MACSSRFFSVTKNATIFASSSSLPNNNTNNNNSNNINNNKKSASSSLPLSPPPSSLHTHQISSKPGGVRRIRNNKQQPSVAEVERAIGAGIFRDRDPRGIGEKPTLFDKILTNPLGKEEGPVEKKLRETGEWILDTTEGSSSSAGRQILLVVCLWILPVWVFFLSVASGLIKLPFSVPYLDDMIM